MYWLRVPNQKISTAKLPVFSKTLKKVMVTKGLALILTASSNLLTYEISGNQSMNVQNRSSGGVAKKRCNLGKTYRDFSGFGIASFHNS